MTTQSDTPDPFEPLPVYTLRKHAYSNILKILPPKNENFQIKISDIFHISAQNIDCGYSLEPPRRGGPNEYPQSMFLNRNKKIIYTPVNPSLTIQKWGLRGLNYIGMFSWWYGQVRLLRFIWLLVCKNWHWHSLLISEGLLIVLCISGSSCSTIRKLNDLVNEKLVNWCRQDIFKYIAIFAAKMLISFAFLFSKKT